MRPRWLLRAAALAGALGWAGCGPSSAPAPSPGASASARPPVSVVPVGSMPLVDLIQELRFCDLDHRGLVFDAGSDMLLGRHGFALDAPDTRLVEHDGASWLRVGARTLKLSFVLPAASPVFVQLRAAGAGAGSATVLLDDQVLGTVTFGRDRIKTVTSATSRLPADAGAHVVSLVFGGRGKKSAEDAPRVDIDWIRIGVPDQVEGTFGAPTLRDVVAEKAALSGIPHRSLAFRAPSRLRCPVRVPKKGGRLVVAAGMQGPGEATGSVRVLRDGKPPLVLAKGLVKGGEGATWTNVDVKLDDVAGELVTLELVADGVPQGGRVLFGDPTVVGPAAIGAADWRARAVVVVVLSGLERDELPGYATSPLPGLDTLEELAKSATVFRSHRSPSTYSSAVLATLLTGRSPTAHRVADMAARLPAAAVGVGRSAREAGVRTAMFTGVPLSFKAFGFAEGWEKFEQFLPQGSALATAPLTEATKWTTEALADPNKRLLLVVHAPGAHPPWDVSAKQLEALTGPGGDPGTLDPRRAAQQLSKLRRKPDGLSLQDHDRVRALGLLALGGQDRALGELVAALKQAGAWDQTLFMVMGDVSSGASREALFADGRELGERALSTPLWVHFPGDRLAATVVDDPTEVLDVARTAMIALGIQPPREGAKLGREPTGRDLVLLGLGARQDPMRAQIARQDERYSVRWGTWVLTGRLGQPPVLCDLSLDPTCAFDRRLVAPMAAQALFRAFVDAELSAQKNALTREPLSLDQDTAAALNVWGETGG